MDKIRVEIDMYDLLKFNYKLNTLFLEGIILLKLREAKIPVKGIFKFGGVKKGKLEWWKDFEKPGIVIYEWSDKGEEK